MRKAVMAGAAVLALGAGAAGLHAAQLSGMFSPRDETAPGACTVIAELPGAEDIVFVPGIGLVTGTMKDFPPGSDGRRGLYRLGARGPELLTAMMPEDFRPHGLGVWAGPDGPLLYVVNHPGKGHSIEVFSAAGRGLAHLRTLTHDLVSYPNDVVVLGEDRFFVTNYIRHEGGVLGALEANLGLPVTDLVYYDRGEARVVEDGLRMANGLAVTTGPEGDSLWLAETFARQVRRYDLDAEAGTVAPAGRIEMGAMPDNITVARDGTLLVAGIQDALAFQAHATGRAASAPALVLRLDPDTEEVSPLLYQEDGLASGVTVGFDDGERLVMGTAFGDRVAACAMP